MHFAAAVLALAAIVAASPTIGLRSCDIVTCAVSLAPDVESCMSAVNAGLSNILDDFDCLKDGFTTVENPPAACSGCFSLQGLEDIGQELGGIFGGLGGTL